MAERVSVGGVGKSGYSQALHVPSISNASYEVQVSEMHTAVVTDSDLPKSGLETKNAVFSLT
jgi:hypothetical protein